MALRVVGLITKVVLPRVFSRFIMFMLNPFIMFLLRGG